MSERTLSRILVPSQAQPGLVGAAWQGGGQPPGELAMGWGLREGVRGEGGGRRSLSLCGWGEKQRACEQGPQAGSSVCRWQGLAGARAGPRHGPPSPSRARCLLPSPSSHFSRFVFYNFPLFLTDFSTKFDFVSTLSLGKLH